MLEISYEYDQCNIFYRRTVQINWVKEIPNKTLFFKTKCKIKMDWNYPSKEKMQIPYNISKGSVMKPHCIVLECSAEEARDKVRRIKTPRDRHKPKVMKTLRIYRKIYSTRKCCLFWDQGRDMREKNLWIFDSVIWISTVFALYFVKTNWDRLWRWLNLSVLSAFLSSIIIIMIIIAINYHMYMNNIFFFSFWFIFSVVSIPR